MEEGNEKEELEIGEKSWKRAMDAAGTSGYREGVDDGSDSVLQEGFDLGYAEAFKAVFAIGVYKAMAEALPKGVKISEEIEQLLESAKTGACFICKTEPTVSSRRKQEEKTLDDIIKAQREHNVHAIKALYDYFVPLLKEHKIELENMNIEDLPHPDRDL